MQVDPACRLCRLYYNIITQLISSFKLGRILGPTFSQGLSDLSLISHLHYSIAGFTLSVRCHKIASVVTQTYLASAYLFDLISLRSILMLSSSYLRWRISLLCSSFIWGAQLSQLRCLRRSGRLSSLSSGDRRSRCCHTFASSQVRTPRFY